MATVTTAVMTKRASRPSAKPTMAWTAAPLRVVCPANSSSHRPASSSPRNNLVERRRAHTAPSTVKMPTDFHSVYPATVLSWWTGPTSAFSPPLDVNDLAERVALRLRLVGRNVGLHLRRHVDPEDESPQRARTQSLPGRKSVDDTRWIRRPGRRVGDSERTIQGGGRTTKFGRDVSRHRRRPPLTGRFPFRSAPRRALRATVLG